jgi:adenylate cyclase
MTGNHVWADRYDRKLEDMFAVQDEIANAVTHAVGPAVVDAEQRRVLRKPPETLGAWEAYQRALWHNAKVSPADLEQARRFLERAIQLDPFFSRAHAMLAMAHIETRNLGISPEAATIAGSEAQKAIAVDPNEPSAFVALAWVAFCSGDHDRMLDYAERAISIAPNYAGAYLAKAAAMVYSGRASEGRQAGTVALRLSPRALWARLCA